MRKSLVAVVLAALAVLALPAPAQAGGPTSVLITNPRAAGASALYYTSAEYRELERLVQTGEPTEEPPSEAMRGTAFTLTWLIHDVYVWRTDLVLLGAVGGPYVGTRMVDLSGEGSEAQLTWVRATQGKALAQLLKATIDSVSSDPGRPATQVGGAPDLVADPSDPADPAESPDASVAADAVVPAMEPATRWFSLAGWRWAIVGLLAGAMVSYAVTRRRPEPLSERRELVDQASEPVSSGHS